MLTSHTSFSLPANAIFFRPQPTAVLPTDTPPDMHQHIKRIRPETILGGQFFLQTNKTPRWTYNGRVFDDTVHGRNPKSLHNMQIALKNISTLVQNIKPTYKWMTYIYICKRTLSNVNLSSAMTVLYTQEMLPYLYEFMKVDGWDPASKNILRSLWFQSNWKSRPKFSIFEKIRIIIVEPLPINTP